MIYLGYRTFDERNGEFNRSFSATYIVGELLSRERESLVKY